MFDDLDRFSTKLAISYKIKSLVQKESNLVVELKFSHAIDMEYLRENDLFPDMFLVYWYPTSGVQTVAWDGTGIEKYEIDSKLNVAESTTIWFEVDLDITYSVDGVLLVDINPLFNFKPLFLEGPE